MASVLERQTKAFIDANPIDVALQRWNEVPTTAGGFQLVKDDVILAQRARLVRTHHQGARVVRTLPDGRVVIEEATLVLEADGDIQSGDTFEAEGRDWIVGVVSRTIHASINAGVGSRG